jgi:hypothetical protein
MLMNIICNLYDAQVQVDIFSAIHPEHTGPEL